MGLQGNEVLLEEETSREEIICMLIDKYADLQRIKKANGSVKNEELEYQIKGAIAKLAAIGVSVTGLIY